MATMMSKATPETTPKTETLQSKTPVLGLTRAWAMLIIVAILLSDIATKLLALDALEYAKPQEVFFYLDWFLIHNKGAAFSFLADAGGWQVPFLLIISSIVALILFVWIWRINNSNHLLTWALSLVVGGALGNLIDRMQRDIVVDFISFHYAGWYFPAFNVADMAISCGAFFLILDAILAKKIDSTKKD